MDNHPLVSIIINNYNYGKFLSDAIDSAIHQTYPNVEIIVVDDGSTDDSLQVIKRFGNSIKVILKENGGQASAINAGFKQSNGSIIILLDADDYLMPGTIEKVVKEFNDDGVVKVHWRLLRVNSEGELKPGVLPDSYLVKGDLREQLIRLGPAHCGGPPHSPPTSGNAWARSFLEKVLPVPEQYFSRGGVDQYLFVLTPVYGEIRSIEEPISYYRIHGNNNTTKSDYMSTFFERYEQCCVVLSYHLSLQGVHILSSQWPRDHWYHKVQDDMNTITNFIPSSATFILVDEDQWMTGEDILGRKRLLFPERNGIYWGVPASDDDAIEELEDDRKNGASFIVFIKTTFWWLEYYSRFQEHLNSLYECILQNERMIIYDLKDKTVRN